MVSIDYYNGRQEELGFTVRDYRYLPAWIHDLIFDPMLTLPWWIDRRDKKREAAKQKTEEDVKNKSVIIAP